ncbi:L,D-transpeptidase family protein [Rhodovulum sp. DZ06]|uniref:L,D-transpeptidase family protein n=1 Tax=Rhodovulum sp. DZ06 TaxID=3425126 RepID=UPI003D347632
MMRRTAQHFLALGAMAGLGLAAAQAAAQTAPAGAPQPEAVAPAPLDRAALAADAARAPLSPLQAALRGAVGALDDADFETVYAARDWAPIWLGDRPARVAAGLLALLDGAESHALPPVADAAGLRDALAALEPLTGDARAAAEAALDVALSRAAVDYGVALNSGVLTPRRVDDEIHVTPERPDRGPLLAELAAAAEPRRVLEGMAPADPGYAALRARLAAFRALAGQGGWQEATPDARVLRLGDSGPQVARLRARLAELGDAPVPAPVKVAAAAAESDAPPAPARFDAGLEEAVKRFQRRHGLNADGVAGRRTFAAMAENAETRMQQIAVNLERMRWMNRDLGARRIIVNQADYMMRVYFDHEVVQEMRVVIGKARQHRTPEFSDEMTHMVVNPSWNVPRSIAEKEILPALKADPSYLVNQNMTLIPKGDTPVPENPYYADWSQYGQGNFPFRIRQAPGPGNALGRVKFMFPNNFAIYLHDTPSRHLFARDARAFSHGCVRVARPIDLAHLLLSGQTDDPAGYFDRLEQRGEEVWVRLQDPLKVHLTYRTAWVDEDTGEDQFRDDVYGRDGRVWAALKDAGLSLL